jgi:hypothetical protein
MRDTAKACEAAADQPARRWKALFICGSMNQTRMMHRIAQALPECEAWYTPYYCDGVLELMRRAHLCDHTILGWPWRKHTMRYLRRHHLPMDYEGRRDDYDLVVTCSDVVMPQNIRRSKVLAVQEGMTDPERFWFWARKLFPLVPRWAAGTAWTGASNLYDRFCVASEGYRDLFIRKGADAHRIVVTGIPNFDDCARYLDNDFPHRDYVLVCTSDTRETLKFDNRKRFIRWAVDTAAARGLPLLFKLHPNEDHQRSTREIVRWAPQAQVFTGGSAEEMVANSRVLICQYSTLAFVGMALGKEVHSYFDLEELGRLLPLQGGMAARNIAEVARGLLRDQPARSEAERAPLFAPSASMRQA